jgi:hypothetical protein
MTESPHLCLTCNRPMALHRSIPVRGGADITIWRCPYCVAPKSSIEAMAEAGELFERPTTERGLDCAYRCYLMRAAYGRDVWRWTV